MHLFHYKINRKTCTEINVIRYRKLALNIEKQLILNIHLDYLQILPAIKI